MLILRPIKWRSLVRRRRRYMRFLIIFSCILLISNYLFFRAIWKTYAREFFKDFKLHSTFGLAIQFLVRNAEKLGKKDENLHC